MKLISNWILLIVIIAIVAGIYLFNGMYNFAATSPHNNLTSLIINESVERSIKKHAKYVDASHLSENTALEEGAEEYDEMCAMCHGAPGLPDSVLHKGLYPKPPKLYKQHDEWTDRELFWILKNGLKMTGMPAYGPTHSDEKLWSIVAFVKKLPGMTEAEYKSLTGNETHHHSHEAEEMEDHHGATPDSPESGDAGDQMHDDTQHPDHD